MLLNRYWPSALVFVLFFTPVPLCWISMLAFGTAAPLASTTFPTKLASIACERNYGRVEWAVLDWNEPAIRFYQSLGAKPMDDWTVFRLTGDELRSAAAI